MIIIIPYINKKEHLIYRFYANLYTVYITCNLESMCLYTIYTYRFFYIDIVSNTMIPLKISILINEVLSIYTNIENIMCAIVSSE